MKKKTGLILGSFLLLSLVLVVGFVMAAVDTTTATVTVNIFLSTTISDPTGGVEVAFGNLDPNTLNNPDGEQDTAQVTPAITIANDAVSNVNVNIDVKGTNFVSQSDGTKTIGVGQVTYDDGAADQGVETDLAETTLATTYGSSYHAGVTPGSSVGFWFFLDVPSGQAAKSDYESTFSFQSNIV